MQAEVALGNATADYEVEPWPVSLTYPSARLLPSRTKVFIEWMKEELRAAV